MTSARSLTGSLIAVILLSGLLNTLRAHAEPQMEPLRAMLDEDESVLPTVFVRCVALQMLIGEWLAAQKSKKNADMSSAYDASAQRFISYWTTLNLSQMEQSPEDRFESLKKHVVVAKRAYYDKMMNAKTLTGHVFSDEVVKDDTLLCSEVDKAFGGQLKDGG